MNRIEEFSKFVDALLEVTRVMHNYDKRPRCYGTDVELYAAEIHTLDKIYNQEGMTVTELAELTNKTKSAITQLTNKLEKKGMIQKLRNKEYHKEINLYLTQLGKDACKYHKELDESNYIEALKYFDGYEIEDFHKCEDIFQIVIGRMNEMGRDK